MIPEGQYDPKRLRELGMKAAFDIRQALGTRVEKEDSWKEYLRAYRAQPRDAHKMFPFEGCSNLVVPLIATDTDKTVAWMMSLLTQHDNLWVVGARTPEAMGFAPHLQEFLKWAQHSELNVYNVLTDFIKDVVLLGTGVIKTRYHRQTKKVYEYRESQTNGPQEQSQVFERHALISMSDSPKIEHVSLWDFLIDPAAEGIEDAAWVAQYVPLTMNQFRDREMMGVYVRGDFMKGRAVSRGSNVTQFQQEQDLYVPYDGTKLDLYEYWCNYDIDGDGYSEALVITIDLPSQQLVRWDFNPYFNQLPPFDAARFIRVSKRFYGVGLGEMQYHGQEEVTAMHNQRIDAVTVRNMPVFWYIPGGTLDADTPIFPGVKIPVRSPNEFGAIPLATGQLVSTAGDEQMSMAIMRERVGVNDFVTGGDGPDVSYATATTAINQLREGRKRLDQSIREVRECLGAVGTKVVELYQQFDQRGKQYTALGSADGAIVTKVLSFPMDQIRASVIVDIAATSAALNKEVEVRTNTLLMQLLQQHGQQQLQLMGLLVSPQVPEPMKQMVFTQLVSAAKLMKRVLVSYDIQDGDDMVFDPMRMLGGNNGNTGQDPTGGAGGMGALPPGPQGLPAVSSGAQAAPAGGGGFPPQGY